MDNNVIVFVNLMRASILHNVGHKNNIHFFAIVGAVFSLYEGQEHKDRIKDLVILSTY